MCELAEHHHFHKETIYPVSSLFPLISFFQKSTIVLSSLDILAVSLIINKTELPHLFLYFLKVSYCFIVNNLTY